MHPYAANMQHSDWNTIRDFLAVARGGSLNQAANTLGVNATTVGRRVEALEAALGVRLFQRAQTGFVLTDEGRDLVDRAEQVEDAALAFERRAEPTDTVSGHVRLATAENLANFIILPALSSLRKKHPNLVVEVLTDIQSANLHRREADLALRLVRPTQGNVTIKRLGEMRYGLYASSEYLSQQSGTEGRSDAGRLDTDQFIAWSDSYQDLPAAKWVERTLQGRSPALVVTSLYAQLVAARESLGMAVLPCFLAASEPSLHHVPSEADTIKQDLWLVLHSDLVASARVRAVADFVEEIVSNSIGKLSKFSEIR
ncbi:MAG: LysR family transcriptional regulator [Phyllobacteriaceae bacterium]|jgi:DNA-binding transcriptional LysR family regulator|nr:LysR family transcriptional regulator [Phyllobacteriaceae bacterium]